LSVIIQVTVVAIFLLATKGGASRANIESFSTIQVLVVILFTTGLSSLNFISLPSFQEDVVQLIVIFLKTASLLFVCLAVGTWEDLYILLLISLVIEICIVFQVSMAVTISSIILILTMLTLQPHVTKNIYIEGIKFSDGIKTVVMGFCAGSFTGLIKRLCEVYYLKEAEVLRLENAVNRIAETNLAYQNYAAMIEEKTIKDERHRITSEIHDIVGYTMTNVLMLVQAALHTRDSIKKRELLKKAQKHISESVDEARLALRRMREREVYTVNPCVLYAQLVKVFSEISGIAISIDFGNVSSYIKPGTEKALYRFLQEGMTNSFRHGKSTSIDISFRHDKGLVTVRMIDDGSGSKSEEIHEGIGITGMRERLENLDGNLIATSVVGGFLLQAVVPGGDAVDE